MKWTVVALVILAGLVVWYLSGRGESKKLLTNLNDEQRKKIADKIKAKEWYGNLVRVSADYNIPAKRISAMVAVESQGNENAIGKAGEKGLMQLMTPAVKDVYEHWGKSYSVAIATGLNLLDAKTNLLIGTCYLAILKKRLNGNLDQATQDYNDGKAELGSAYLNEVKEFENYF